MNRNGPLSNKKGQAGCVSDKALWVYVLGFPRKDLQLSHSLIIQELWW